MNGKIFFITNTCTHYSVRLYELLAQKADVEYYFTGGEEPYWEKGNQARTGKFKGEYLKGFFLLPRLRVTPGLLRVLFKKFDILIKTIDDRFALPLTFLCAKILRRPFIFWVGLWQHRKTLFNRLTYAFTRLIYRYSDAIVVYGEHIRQYLLTLGVDEKKIFCAPHAVDNDCFNKDVSREDKKNIRTELGADGKVLLYVGRLESCKGLEYLVAAVAGLGRPDVVLVFIGRGSQREILEKVCGELSVPCKFLDFVPNERLYRYYAAADVFILPSVTTADFKEPWGLVINEAMNQGCPIIATDAVGAAAGGLVQDGRNGFIAPEKDSLALQEAIRKLIADEPLRLRMSADSRERIKAWTPENMAQGFLDAVEYVAGKSSVVKRRLEPAVSKDEA